MKRPLAYITAPWSENEFENTENAAKYCRAVYDAGFSPVCPTLFLPLFLRDEIPQEHKDGIDLAREYLRRAHVLVVCGSTVDESVKNDRQKHQYSKANPHGKMTVKQLAAKDKGLQSIEVTDQNIGSFNRIARKYGIDFAPFKVKGEKRYMVFFKAPDADAMTTAFKEYTAKQVRKAERPSVLEKLQHFKSLIQAAVVDRTKRKELER